MPTAPLAYEAFLEVYNSGKEARPVEITISGAGQQRIVKNVRIDAGRVYKEALDLSKFDGGGIRAALRSDGDAFSPDDIAYAYLPVKRRTKTLLVTSGNKFLENALKLDRLVELSVDRSQRTSRTARTSTLSSSIVSCRRNRHPAGP